MKITHRIRFLIFVSIFFLWGIVTGRTLPQWNDANGVMIYWIFFSLAVMGIYFIYISKAFNPLGNEKPKKGFLRFATQTKRIR